MGGAIVRGVFAAHKPWQVTAIATSMDRLTDLKTEFDDLIISVTYPPVADSNIVILAVKPQSFDDLASEIKPLLREDVLVVSIMAGVSAKKIQAALGVTKVVRAMPNLGAQFGQSMTVWTGENLTSEDEAFTHAFFATMGEEICVPSEDLVNKTTAVSASGVGFFAYIIEAYVAQAVALGFSGEEATKIVLQTLHATNTILQKKQKSPEELRVAVTSKKGTTEAGLTALMDGRLSKIFAETLEKAYTRANELSS